MTHPRLTQASLALLAAALLAAPAPASAQEEIFLDPENADPQPPPTSESPQSEEIFTDPENADTRPKPDAPTPPPPTRVGYTSGRYRLTGAIDLSFDRGGEDIYELYNVLELRTHQPVGERAWMEISARLAHGLYVPRDDDADARALYAADLGDAWLSTRWGSLLLRVGQQRIVWGSAELTRPADVVNPQDLTQTLGPPSGAPGISVTRPILAAKLDWVGELASLSLVVIPFFEPHRLSLLSTDFGLARGSSPLAAKQPFLGLLGQLIDPSLVDGFERAFAGTRIPDQTPQNASAGLRLTSNALGPDLALSWLYGWDRTPDVHVDPALGELLNLVAQDGQVLRDLDLVGFIGRNPAAFGLQQQLAARAAQGEPLLDIRYHRWHVLAADGAGYIGPIGVRADLAFSPERTFLTANLTSLRRPATNAALGLSWEADAGQLVVTAEGFWLHVFDVPPSPTDARPFLFDADLYGLAFGIRADLEAMGAPAPLVLQLGGVASARDGDSLLNLGAAWRFDAATRLSLDLQLFNPPLWGSSARSSTLGGLYDTNDRALLSFERSL